MTQEELVRLADEKSVKLFERNEDGEWVVVKLKELCEGDTFRPYTPGDTSDDRTWFIATTDAFVDTFDQTWTIESAPLNREVTEEDGGDVPTEED
jgi:hypothetical protein